MRLLKFLPVFLLLVLINSCNVASKSNSSAPVSTGVQFIEDDWSTALKKAKDQNKLVFLDIYATWCGPCKMLKEYTFTDTSVGSFFNTNFINVSVDGEKGVGPQLAQQYSIEGYPSLIITDAEGKPVLITAGYLQAQDILKFAGEALKRNQSHSKL